MNWLDFDENRNFKSENKNLIALYFDQKIYFCEGKLMNKKIVWFFEQDFFKHINKWLRFCKKSQK